MARQKDPYRGYKFKVTIDDFTRAGFKMIEGLSREIEVIEYREGGDNSTPRKIPGQATFPNLVMERGKSSDSDFISWMNEIYETTNGFNQPPDDDFRRTITIDLFSKSGVKVKSWRAFECWPCKLEHDALDAEDKAGLAIERLEICHEGLQELSISPNDFI